jgi:RimJ/RimL family protein N-acetyltransferase
VTAAFVLHEPSLNDVDELALLHTSTWRETYSGQVPETWLDDRAVERCRRMWAEMIASPKADATAVVAERDGVLIGFAVAGPPQSPELPPRQRELYMIYLAAAAHGSGAGQAMLDRVLDGQPAYVWVAKRNPRAQAFYKRNGFMADGAEKEFAAVPGFVEVRMVRG